MDLILLQFGEDNFTRSDPRSDGAVSDERLAALSNPSTGVNLKPGNCVELISVQQGMRQQVTTDVSNSARTSGRPFINDFTCVKYVDANSPKMYDYCLRAKPLDSDVSRPTTIFILRNSGDQLSIVMWFELRSALISEIQFQSHPNDMATEQFKLNFSEIIWHHKPAGSALQSNDQTTAGWSVARNRPINKLTD